MTLFSEYDGLLYTLESNTMPRHARHSSHPALSYPQIHPFLALFPQFLPESVRIRARTDRRIDAERTAERPGVDGVSTRSTLKNNEKW